MNFRIAICDDEEYYREYMQRIVKDYFQRKGNSCQIHLFSCGGDFCANAEAVDFDILFLDIGMEGQNGMDTAYEIRKRGLDMEIVFVTAFRDYVFEGYKVGAVRYILKTELEKEVSECLDAILKNHKREERSVCFSFVKGQREILLSDLYYVESKAHKLVFKVGSDELAMYDVLDHVEERLSEQYFIRCHQSYLVNLEHIVQIKGYRLYLSDGTEIPVSRTRYQETKKQLLHYKEI